ncbi:hypothetical protein DV737_g1817, partial [Chaetothyriales sp. CBS 132003]
MKTPYLLHALLGVAAAHMAHLLAAEAKTLPHPRYRLADAYHWAHALRLLREEISSRGATVDNMDGLLSANMLVTRSFVFVEDDVEREGALKWLVVQSGFNHLLSKLEVHLHRSVWLPVLLDARIEGREEGGDHQPPRPPQQQQQPRGGMPWQDLSQVEYGPDKVETLLWQFCGIGDGTLASESPYLECLQLVVHMRRMRPITCHHFNKMVTFLGRVTPAFRQLLLDRDTAALLILTYWLYLLTGIRQWWLIDRAETECKAIIMFLRSRLETAPSSVVAELLREPARAIGLESASTRSATSGRIVKMSGEAWLYLLAVLINAVNLFLQVFFTIMYSDLECDYINPIDLCNRLNTYIVPEAAVQAFLTFLFLINGYWLALLLNLPLLAFNAKKIIENQHLLDATEIFRKLNVHKKESFIKLGFHLVMFFFYLYSMIVALIREESG